MQRSPPTSVSDTPNEASPTEEEADGTLPYCLVCGYERKGLSERASCPECGAPSTHDAHRLVESAFRRPLRRATASMIGRAELGWWCLLPTRLRVAARVQMVLGLTLATVVLATYFLLGAHVRVYVAMAPNPLAAPRDGIEFAEAENAILGGLVRGDMSWAREAGAVPIAVGYPVGQPPALPFLEFVKPSVHPFVIASAVWAACVPAAGLLCLRFVLLPIALRCMRRTLTAETRLAATIAADATVASTAIASAATVIGFAALAFGMAIVLPTSIAAALIRTTPAILLTLLFVLPPLLFAGAIRTDRARRVFAWPTAAAALTFGSYFIGVGLGVGVIAATFAIATRAFG